MGYKVALFICFPIMVIVAVIIFSIDYNRFKDTTLKNKGYFSHLNKILNGFYKAWAIELCSKMRKSK